MTKTAPHCETRKETRPSVGIWIGLVAQRFKARPKWPYWTGLLLLFALFVTYWPISTTFDASVKTESLSVTSETGHVAPRWYLKSAMMADGGGESQVFDGEFEPAEGTTITFERIGRGPLLISCKSAESAQSAGSLFDSQDQLLRMASNNIVFRVENMASRSDYGETVVVPFMGDIRLGRSVRRETSAYVPMLREGKIRLLGQSILLGTRFDSGEIELEPGDEFFVPKADTAASGFLLADDAPGAVVVARQVGKTGVVKRFGAEGYLVGTSVVGRLRNDGLVQVAWVTFLFFLGLPEVLKRAKG